MLKLFSAILLFLLLFTKGWTAEMNKDSFVPEWSKRVVWYQIFPERFHNGDTSNDPTVNEVKGAWPHDGVSPWQVHPWGSDWYELLPYEKENGKDIWYNIQRRRYGGDLQGIIDKLDYLQNLGITAIYLNPVFDSPSLHKYDAIRYEHIDPNLGPDPDGDRALMAKESPNDPASWNWTSADKMVLKLIKECHKRGIKIVFDGVFNHIGIRNPMFEDLRKNQQKSKYKDWFVVTSWDDELKGTKFDYESWYGFKELPEWREDENGIVSGPKKYIFDITKRWMDPDGNGDVSDGIDGWRLDVAYCVKHPFWKDWSKYVKSINPESYMTAEIIDTPEVNKPYLQGDEFTAVMNYNFAFSATEFFCGKNGKRLMPSEFDKSLKELRDAYEGDYSYGMQNLFDSHDTARFVSHIRNRKTVDYRDWHNYCQWSQAAKGKFDTTKPDVYDYSIQKLMALFQMTYVGAPMIYYGDEVGMWGANDPCCRKPMLWDGLDYVDEVYLPDGTKRENGDKVSPDMDMYSYYSRLIHLRNQHVAFQIGDFKPVLIDDEKQLYAYMRSYQDEKIITVLNNGMAASLVEIPIDEDLKVYEYDMYKSDSNTDRNYYKLLDVENGKCSFILTPKRGKVIFLSKELFNI